jgi:hypothetical protein
MKPVPIADYLDHIGRVPGEKASPRRETSPFRPRSLQNPHGAEQRSLPVIDRAPKPAELQDEHAQRSPWGDRKTVPIDSSPKDSLLARETVKAQEMALRLAEAHARGREEGFAEGQAEAEERLAAERAAVQEQAVMEPPAFQLNEYAQLEASIRTCFAQVEDNVGAAVTRILAPFLVKELVKYVADELCQNIARLTASASPGLITIRGPERVMSLLRERIGDLPVEVDYIEDGGVEAVVESNATRIATELKPWAELLGSLEA